MRYLLEFESFNDSLSESAIVESIYSRILEEEEAEAEKALTPRERSNIERDLQNWTEPMFACTYLRALGAVDGNPDKYIDGIVNVDNDKLNIKDFCEPNGKYSIAGLADSIGAKSEMTFIRCTNKFKNLITGVGATPGETINPKIRKAFDNFDEMDVNQVGQIAGETLQPSTNTAARDSVEGRSLRMSNQRELKKSKLKEMGRQAITLINGLKKAMPSKSKEDIVNMATMRVAQQFDVTAFQAKNALDAYIKDSGVKLIV